MVVTELRRMTPGHMGLLPQVERAPSKCLSSHRRSETATPRMPYLSNSSLLHTGRVDYNVRTSSPDDLDSSLGVSWRAAMDRMQ